MKTALVISAILLFSAVPLAFAEDRLAVLHTPSGDLVIEFFADKAPNHVKAFIEMVESGGYDKTVFHRVIENFMIQGGDTVTKPGMYNSTDEWGSGESSQQLDAEFNDISHTRGIVSMARSGEHDSAGTQFFVIHQNATFLDRQYTAFGRLATQNSYDTLDVIATLNTTASMGENGTAVPINWTSAVIESAEVVSRDSVDFLDQGPTTIVPYIFHDGGVYISERYDVEFELPAGWQIAEPVEVAPGTANLELISPDATFLGPIILITIEPTEDITLADKSMLIDESLAGQARMDPNEKMTLHDREVIIKNYRINAMSPPLELLIAFESVLFEENGNFYTITYLIADNDVVEGPSEFDDMLATFKVVKSDAGGWDIFDWLFGWLE